VAAQYVAEGLINWFPFYWEMKTVFLLFLSLPQTEGSTYVYDTYLQPFFAKNEAELDAGIIKIHHNTVLFVQRHLSNLFEFIWGLLLKAGAARQPAGSEQTPSAGTPFSLDSAMSLWRTYGPALMGGPQGQAGQTKAASAAPVTATPATATPATASTTSVQATPPSDVSQSVPSASDVTPTATPTAGPSIPVPQTN